MTHATGHRPRGDRCGASRRSANRCAGAIRARMPSMPPAHQHRPGTSRGQHLLGPNRRRRGIERAGRRRRRARRHRSLTTRSIERGRSMATTSPVPMPASASRSARASARRPARGSARGGGVGDGDSVGAVRRRYVRGDRRGARRPGRVERWRSRSRPASAVVLRRRGAARRRSGTPATTQSVMASSVVANDAASIGTAEGSMTPGSNRSARPNPPSTMPPFDHHVVSRPPTHVSRPSGVQVSPPAETGSVGSGVEHRAGHVEEGQAVEIACGFECADDAHRRGPLRGRRRLRRACAASSASADGRRGIDLGPVGGQIDERADDVDDVGRSAFGHGAADGHVGDDRSGPRARSG